MVSPTKIKFHPVRDLIFTTVPLRSFCYDMTSGKHGKALIINISKEREGSDKDRENLKDTLTKIGYEVEIRENLDGIEKDEEKWWAIWR